jgi:hypothetical protein
MQGFLEATMASPWALVRIFVLVRFDFGACRGGCPKAD